MNNNLVTPSITTTKNVYTSKKLTVENNIINADLYNTTTTTKKEDRTINDVLTNIELKEKEYSLEELLEEARKERIINQQKIELELAKQKQTNIDAVNSFATEISNLDFSKVSDVEKVRKLFDGLTDDQKKLLNPKFEKNLKQVEETIKKLEELENLYKQREENNGLFHPKLEKEIENKIKVLEKELNIEHKSDGWEKFLDDPLGTIRDTKTTLATSFVFGLLDVVETIGDGALMVSGFLCSSVSSIWDDELSEEFKNTTKSMVEYDWTGAGYYETSSFLEIDQDIAYGLAHSVGEFTGQVLGYAAISMIPGGGLFGGFAAAGSTAETAFENEASFDQAMIASTASGIFGTIAGGTMEKLGKVAKGANTLKSVFGYTMTGAVIGGAEPLANSFAEYYTYGNNDGSSYLEYMDKSGGWWDVAIGTGAGGFSLGIQSYVGYKDNQYKVESNQQIDLINDSQKSQSFEDYLNQNHSVEHISRNSVDNFNMYENFSIEQIYDDMVEKGLITKEKVNLNKLKTMFKNDCKIIINGSELSITKDEAIKRTMMELYINGSGGGKTSSELFKDFGMTLGEAPKGTLSALESRVWYLENEKMIPNLLDDYVKQNPNATLIEQANFCYNKRKEFRVIAREAMSDDVMRLYLNITENTSFDDLFEMKKSKYAVKYNIDIADIDDSKIYEEIIDSSTKSRTILNDLLGIGE